MHGMPCCKHLSVLTCKYENSARTYASVGTDTHMISLSKPPCQGVFQLGPGCARRPGNRLFSVHRVGLLTSHIYIDQLLFFMS